jgi:hypothetical protein
MQNYRPEPGEIRNKNSPPIAFPLKALYLRGVLTSRTYNPARRDLHAHFSNSPL